MAKSTFLTFFLEGTNADGERVHDVRYVMLRKNHAYAPARSAPASEQAKAALACVFGAPADPTCPPVSVAAPRPAAGDDATDPG